MPSCGMTEGDWRELCEQRRKYKAKLIKKGVIDGTQKMMKLMIKKFNRR